ncbi:polysaccharide pyruvyl transferase family protein [Pseudomonas sp. GL-B-12]|uniref:polysaccharide pyruvyl transferase family protein n=1 Tax=Pseudomonas sp. GL-B-12 TaxID=2832374 RepID=UPI001CBA811C|nr:polysaccharide pyruvyl transferase family protein [Pseudomonas sp. GL-B-12]
MQPKLNKEHTFWWSPRSPLGLNFLRKENAGDLLGPHLVHRILERSRLDAKKIQTNNRLISIGSVLHFARNGDTIWGTGVNGKVDPNLHKFTNLNIKALRGPLTAHFLNSKNIKTPDVYGDPGILTSRFWPKSDNTSGETIYIPHMREVVDTNISSRFKVISPLMKLELFINEIQKASKVISTSLHGIIIAESYGIPAVLVENNSGETLFKYNDYFLGTGRDNVLICKDFNSALNHTPPIPDLKKHQDDLLNSFPYELWMAY